MQTGLLRRTISPHCPAGAKRIIRTRNQPPGSLRERAPALRQLARADDGYAARGKQRRIALREQHCRAALAQRLPQPRGIACRQSRNRDDPVPLRRAQITRKLCFARQKPHDAPALLRRIAEPCQIARGQLP